MNTQTKYWTALAKQKTVHAENVSVGDVVIFDTLTPAKVSAVKHGTRAVCIHFDGPQFPLTLENYDFVTIIPAKPVTLGVITAAQAANVSQL